LCAWWKRWATTRTNYSTTTRGESRRSIDGEHPQIRAAQAHDAAQRIYEDAEGEPLRWLRVRDKDAIDYMLMYRQGSQRRRVAGL
jgi:hypothetical protein